MDQHQLNQDELLPHIESDFGCDALCAAGNNLLRRANHSR
jgi:hypothetical protein